MPVILAPAWLAPAENTGLMTPAMVQYALHEARFKPMPEGRMAPCLAEFYYTPVPGSAGLLLPAAGRARGVGAGKRQGGQRRRGRWKRPFVFPIPQPQRRRLPVTSYPSCPQTPP